MSPPLFGPLFGNPLTDGLVAYHIGALHPPLVEVPLPPRIKTAPQKLSAAELLDAVGKLGIDDLKAVMPLTDLSTKERKQLAKALANQAKHLWQEADENYEEGRTLRAGAAAGIANQYNELSKALSRRKGRNTSAG